MTRPYDDFSQCVLDLTAFDSSLILLHDYLPARDSDGNEYLLIRRRGDDIGTFYAKLPGDVWGDVFARYVDDEFEM